VPAFDGALPELIAFSIGEIKMVGVIKDVAAAATRSLFAILILALTALFLAGCIVPSYGRLQSDPEVTRVFEQSQILSNHQYYINGFQRVPYAIIAIDGRYQLRSKRWQPIDIDGTTLNQLVYRMEHVYSLNPRGAWILDPEGNRLGIWYSSTYQTAVRREANNRIIVGAPEPPDLRGIH
jgi:hypothetical protein